MTRIQEPPKTIGEPIDELERIREELLHLQRQSEKREIVEAALSDDEQKELSGVQLRPWRSVRWP
jgi:hypothetical protein